MTEAGEQAFFRALGATANVRLSAAAAGFSHAAFYAKKRVSARFDRQMRRSIEIGCDRLQWALDERALQLLGEGDDLCGLAFDDNPLPPMTVDQCIHLVTLHSVRQARTRPPAGENEAAAERRRAGAERARHYERTGEWRFPHEPPPPSLPPLHLVTGWSKADPDRARVTHNPDLPLFGASRTGRRGRRRRELGSVFNLKWRGNSPLSPAGS